MITMPAARELELVAVRAGAGDWPALRRHLRSDPPPGADVDLDELACLLRQASGTADGDQRLAELEEAAVRASAGRWTRQDMAGWTVTTLVHYLAERLGPVAAIGQLRRLTGRDPLPLPDDTA